MTSRNQIPFVNEPTSRIGNAYYRFWKSVEDAECLIHSPNPHLFELFTRMFSHEDVKDPTYEVG